MELCSPSSHVFECVLAACVSVSLLSHVRVSVLPCLINTSQTLSFSLPCLLQSTRRLGKMLVKVSHTVQKKSLHASEAMFHNIKSNTTRLSPDRKHDK